MEPIWKLIEGDGPLVAAAIHAGHAVRDEVARRLALPEQQRLREEDPFTDIWTHVADTRIVGLHSRFEVDLNRPPDGAVYLSPEDAWGLDVWQEPPSPQIVDRSLQRYHAFYDTVERLLTEKIDRHGFALIFDIHAYNHRRDGPDAGPADPAQNPEVNVGTGTMDRDRWAPVADAFIDTLRRQTVKGEPLDVRENVRFTGGFFPEWVHTTFSKHACALAIEFKKTFMDEWTGEPDRAHIEAIREALVATVPETLQAMDEVTATSHVT
jgi:N-formylglutamate amidohydrolase